MSWEEWSKRPARRQVDEASLEKHLREEAQKERNVWNGRVIGGGGDGPGGEPNLHRMQAHPDGSRQHARLLIEEACKPAHPVLSLMH